MSIGRIFKFTSFGESHGPCIGGVIEGCPSNFLLDFNEIHSDLQNRAPSDFYETARKEPDKVVFLSGIFEGRTTGHPIAFTIANTSQNSSDYEHLKDIYRPSHADFTYEQKYGIRDYRGGGRSSARETAARVVAGSVAKQILRAKNINLFGFVSQIGTVKADFDIDTLKFEELKGHKFRFASAEKIPLVEDLLMTCKAKGDTVGGVVTCVLKNVPVGLGEPVYDKLQANLAKAMFSINAVKGFDYGAGFEAASMFGSEHNDFFTSDFSTQTNNSGGIQGGISNGQDIYFRVAFKPIASLQQPVEVVTRQGEKKIMTIGGRHDVCVVPRAVPIVESMAAMVLLDHWLLNQAIK